MLNPVFLLVVLYIVSFGLFMSELRKEMKEFDEDFSSFPYKVFLAVISLTPIVNTIIAIWAYRERKQSEKC
jgi:hypothetical protein